MRYLAASNSSWTFPFQNTLRLSIVFFHTYGFVNPWNYEPELVRGLHLHEPVVPSLSLIQGSVGPRLGTSHPELLSSLLTESLPFLREHVLL